MLKDEDWFLRRFQFIEFKWKKKMKILLEAVTEKKWKILEISEDSECVRKIAGTQYGLATTSTVSQLALSISHFSLSLWRLQIIIHFLLLNFFLYSYHQNSSCVFVWIIHVAPLNSRREYNFILFYIGSEWSCRKTSTKRAIKKQKIMIHFYIFFLSI